LGPSTDSPPSPGSAFRLSRCRASAGGMSFSATSWPLASKGPGRLVKATGAAAPTASKAAETERKPLRERDILTPLVNPWATSSGNPARQREGYRATAGPGQGE